MRPLTDNSDRIVMEVENQLFELYKDWYVTVKFPYKRDRMMTDDPFVAARCQKRTDRKLDNYYSIYETLEMISCAIDFCRGN